MTGKPAFSERLAYALWLYALNHGGRVPGNATIARAVGRTGPAVTQWLKQDYAPPDYEPKDSQRKKAPLHEALASYLDVPKDWLIDGVGEPPEPELWRQWIVRQRHHRASSAVAAKQRKRGS
jgi:hypothetical protein